MPSAPGGTQMAGQPHPAAAFTQGGHKSEGLGSRCIHIRSSRMQSTSETPGSLHPDLPPQVSTRARIRRHPGNEFTQGQAPATSGKRRETSVKCRTNVGTAARSRAPETREKLEDVGKTAEERWHGSRRLSARSDPARGAEAWHGETLRKLQARKTSESRRGNVGIETGKHQEDVGKTSGRRREDVGKTSEDVGIGRLWISGWPVQVLAHGETPSPGDGSAPSQSA
eukprot:gene13217-biopygen8205